MTGPSVPLPGTACELPARSDLARHSPRLQRWNANWIRRGAVALVSVVAISCSPSIRAQADVPAIAAASDLQFALDEISKQFRVSAKRELKLVFGSSGNFFRQIGQGAPFQMFMSADEAFVLKLEQAGKLVDKGHLYATGRIVLFAPHGSRLPIDAKLDAMRSALAMGQIKRFAIANPEHAPYGRAAEEALRNMGLWEAIRPRLVLGENVSQAAQFASSGSADGGIFAYSLALSPQIGKLGRYVLIPDAFHQPLHQRMALVKGAGETARMFYEYLQAPAARGVFRQYGFVLPGEQ